MSKIVLDRFFKILHNLNHEHTNTAGSGSGSERLGILDARRRCLPRGGWQSRLHAARGRARERSVGMLGCPLVPHAGGGEMIAAIVLWLFVFTAAYSLQVSARY